MYEVIYKLYMSRNPKNESKKLAGSLMLIIMKLVKMKINSINKNIQTYIYLQSNILLKSFLEKSIYQLQLDQKKYDVIQAVESYSINSSFLSYSSLLLKLPVELTVCALGFLVWFWQTRNYQF